MRLKFLFIFYLLLVNIVSIYSQVFISKIDSIIKVDVKEKYISLNLIFERSKDDECQKRKLVIIRPKHNNIESSYFTFSVTPNKISSDNKYYNVRSTGRIGKNFLVCHRIKNIFIPKIRLKKGEKKIATLKLPINSLVKKINAVENYKNIYLTVFYHPVINYELANYFQCIIQSGVETINSSKIELIE